jgi:SPW repeat
MLRSIFHHLRDTTRARPFGREVVQDALQLACSAGLFGSPWVFALSPTASWNLWVCGYAMLAISLAALVAEADWEPKANFSLGAWVAVAPWILAFATDPVATVVHLSGGGLISILSAVELWNAERNPPWRFRPGAASRAAFAPAILEWPASVRITRPSQSDIRQVPRVGAATKIFAPGWQNREQLMGTARGRAPAIRRWGLRARASNGPEKEEGRSLAATPSTIRASSDAGGDSNAMPNRDPFDDLRPCRGDISGTGTDRPLEFQRKLPVRAAAGVMSVGPNIFGHAIRRHAATQERHGRTGRCPSHQRYDHKRGSTLEHAWSGPQWRDRMVERHQVAKAVASNSR